MSGSGRAGDVSPLAVLGLSPGADEEEIRTAYRRLAMRYHPDSSGDPATAWHFARIVRAYKVLTAQTTPPPALGSVLMRRYRRVIEAGDDLFALGQLLASDPDAGARIAAARALGLSGRTAAYVFLRRALYDAAEKVRLEAVLAVARLGSMQAAGEIAALYTRSSPTLRRAIIEIAAATGERLFRETLLAASKDPDPELRQMAGRFVKEP